jgi:hypothetical protein
MDKRTIEKIEFTHLVLIDSVLKDSLDELKNKIQGSLRYIDYLTVPLIISSLEGKAYNPFSEIFEKYIIDLVSSKLENKGFKSLPLGYSSDMCFESDKVVLHVDVKTANFDNPSDFKNTIPMGMNQFTYPGIIPVKVKTRDNDSVDISEEASIRVWPNLPPSYINKNGKLTLTYGILLLYPPYKDIVDRIRTKYIEIRNLIKRKLKTEVKSKVEKELEKEIVSLNQFLDIKIKNTTKSKGDKISENVIRACLIHGQIEHYTELMNFSDNEKNKLIKFKEEIEKISKKLAELNILPISIIIISAPNGFLAPDYDGNLVSGKSFAESIRYHYEEGEFKNLDDKPRVIFNYIDEDYKDKILKIFNNVFVLDQKGKILHLTKSKKLADF